MSSWSSHLITKGKINERCKEEHDQMKIMRMVMETEYPG